MAKPTTPQRRKASASRARTTARSAAAPASLARGENDPVALPSGGSFELGALQSGLDKAKDQAAVSAVLADATDGHGTIATAPNSLPDHGVAKVEVNVGGDRNVTEFRQVYTGEAGEPVEPADVSGARSTATSEIVSSELVSETVSAAASTAADPATVPATTGESGAPGSTSNTDKVEDAIRSTESETGSAA